MVLLEDWRHFRYIGREELTACAERGGLDVIRTRWRCITAEGVVPG